MAIAGAGGGCADSSSKTDLLGEPKILQVFVNDPTDSSDPDGSGLALTFGVHSDINLCTFDNTCTTTGIIAGTTDTTTMPIPGEHCDITSAPGAFSLRGHCVQDSDNQQPIATNAAIAPGASLIWVVVGDLLDGATLEEFACACQEDPTKPGDLGSVDPSNCPAGDKAWSADPLDCSACGGGTQQKGQCEDTDGNGIPDVSALLPGVATITCGSLLGGEAGTTKLGDGWFNPSGNQLPARGSTGWLGLGPSIAIAPSFALPADEDCTVVINSSTSSHLALDKQGRQLTVSGDIKFHTEAMTAASTSPEDKSEDNSKAPASITISFNTTLKSSSVTAPGAVTVSPAIPGSMVDLASGSTIEIAPATGDTLTLQPNTTYTVTVSGNVTDTYGKKLGEDFTFSFKTES